MLKIAFTDGSIRPWDDDETKKIFWHSSAHLMAEALESLYPGVRFGVGPAVETGFYYDVDLGGHQISESDLKKVEDKMIELARSKETFERSEVCKADAIKYFTEKGDPYKLELISDLEDGTITFYKNGNFTDLCRGPHILHVDDIKAVKLTAIAGAYWKGDQSRQQLTRIYGVTFPKKSMLDEYLVMLEEAKKRDHRKLGKEMQLFTFSGRVGLGLPLWLPRGAQMRNTLESFLRRPQEGEEYMLKPMNCPHHCEIFRSEPRSYRDLPLRFAEFGTVYRYEQSGELHGLTRVRGFTQDDAHLFCRPDQLQEEFEKVIDLILYVFRTLKMTDYMAQISLLEPENQEIYIVSDENWDKAEKAIIEAAERKGLKTVVELGEAAFYGPKLDFMVKDAIGRKWQLGTIQVDYNLPERFQLEYIDADDSRKRPVMIHRAPFGSLERFTAVVLEHTAGHLAVWLAPVLGKVLPISEKFTDYAEKVCSLLKNSEIRASVDARNERLGKRIRDISLLRVPILVIVGEKEATEGSVSVRREGVDQGSMSIQQFIDYIKSAIAEELA